MFMKFTLYLKRTLNYFRDAQLHFLNTFRNILSVNNVISAKIEKTDSFLSQKIQSYSLEKLTMFYFFFFYFSLTLLYPFLTDITLESFIWYLSVLMLNFISQFKHIFKNGILLVSIFLLSLDNLNSIKIKEIIFGLFLFAIVFVGRRIQRIAVKEEIVNDFYNILNHPCLSNQAVIIINSNLQVKSTNYEAEILKSQIDSENHIDTLKSLRNECNQISLFKELKLHPNKSWKNTIYKYVRTFNNKTIQKIYSIDVINDCFSNGEITIMIKDMTLLVEIEDKKINQKYQNLILFSISHELKNPVVAIYSSISQLYKNPNKISKNIGIVSAKVLEIKIKLLTDYVQIMNSTFSPNKELFTPKKSMQKLIKLSKIVCTKKNVFVQEKIDDNLPYLVCGDWGRIEAMLIHLVCNAIKYTNFGFIKISAEYVNDNNISSIRFSVEDSGMGICIKRNSIFQIRSSESSSISEIAQESERIRHESKLSGIGLTACHAICKSLGTELQFDSKLGKGTRFTFVLKVEENSEDLISNRSDHLFTPEACEYSAHESISRKMILYCQVPNSSPASKKYTFNFFSPPKIIEQKKFIHAIIITDDNQFNRYAIRTQLESKNIENIFEAENGVECIDLIQKIIYTLEILIIFMDIDMPVMDGITATRKIRKLELCHEIIIAGVTAFDNAETRNECLKSGFNYFYSKPLKPKNLDEIIKLINK